MKGSSIFIFLAIVLTVFSLLNYYIIRRGWQALAGTGGFRTAVLIVYGALTVCFFAGHALTRGRPGKFAGHPARPSAGPS